ncbi:hypothetical protein BDZ45DRAFT_153004 [Acephala macrosclerotiorum]|nr:hypothetical protein BDZ45DRAFT_153004 [Acephala macrosclerotiorum]
MIVERNVAIPADDGLKLCADIFRPDDEKSALVIIPKVPMEKASSTKTAIRINGTGFWRPIQTFFQVKPAKSFMTREAADPELWTKWGYVYIRIDSRGTGRTPEFLDIFSPREIKDFYDAIE